MLPPLLDVERSQTTISLSTPPSISCRNLTPGHESYSYTRHFQQQPSSAPAYYLSLLYTPNYTGMGISLPTPVTQTYLLIYN